MRICASGSSAAKAMSTPMRRMRSACCARAASGHAAAAPSSVMNPRRLMSGIRIPPRGLPHAQPTTHGLARPWSRPKLVCIEHLSDPSQTRIAHVERLDGYGLPRLALPYNVSVAVEQNAIGISRGRLKSSPLIDGLTVNGDKDRRLEVGPWSLDVVAYAVAVLLRREPRCHQFTSIDAQSVLLNNRDRLRRPRWRNSQP